MKHIMNGTIKGKIRNNELTVVIIPNYYQCSTVQALPATVPLILALPATAQPGSSGVSNLQSRHCVSGSMASKQLLHHSYIGTTTTTTQVLLCQEVAEAEEATANQCKSFMNTDRDRLLTFDSVAMQSSSAASIPPGQVQDLVHARISFPLYIRALYGI